MNWSRPKMMRRAAAVPAGPVAGRRKDRRDELLGLTPGDAPSARWAFEATATPAGGGFDLKGPYIQGRPGTRFIYLSWGTVDDDGTFTMFRRAKLWLDAIARKPAPTEIARPRHRQSASNNSPC